MGIPSIDSSSLRLDYYSLWRIHVELYTAGTELTTNSLLPGHRVISPVNGFTEAKIEKSLNTVRVQYELNRLSYNRKIVVVQSYDLESESV